MVDPHFGGNGALKRLRTVALGYADPDDIVNTFITPREPVESFSVFIEE